MEPRGDHGPMELPPALVDLGRRQHGAFTTRQAEEHGVGSKGLTRLVRRGAIRRLRFGVYASALQPDSRELEVMSAVLAGGAGAVASHGTAAKLHGMYWGASEAIEITVPHRRRVSIRGVIVHRSVHLEDENLTVIDGIPATTRARTLRDLAASHHEIVLERAVDENVADGVPVREIHERLEAGGPVAGRPKLRRIIDRHDPQMRGTRSEVERMALRVARRSGIPGIVTNHRVADRHGRERFLDLAVPRCRVGAEVDTERHHGTTLGRHRDGRRQNALVLDDWLILRFDLRDLRDDPDRVVDDLLAAVALRGT